MKKILFVYWLLFLSFLATRSCQKQIPHHQYDSIQNSDLLAVYRYKSDDKVFIDTIRTLWYKAGKNGNSLSGFVIRKTYRTFDRVGCPREVNGFYCLTVHYGYIYRREEVGFLDSLKHPMQNPANNAKN